MKNIQKPTSIMSKNELRSALTRAILIEYQNAKTPGRMTWGWDRPPSLFVAKLNRIRLATLYDRKYQKVNKRLFKKNLPSGKDWRGVKNLL